jgi:hypothetical protein
MSKYRGLVKSATSSIDELKNILINEDLTSPVRKTLHRRINAHIERISDLASSAEADVLLMGADNLKEVLSLSAVRDSILNKAGVESSDTQEMASEKVKTYLATLDKRDANNIKERLDYVDRRKNEIISGLNYDTAIESVFGDKGAKIAETLDDKLTPQEKKTLQEQWISLGVMVVPSEQEQRKCY